MIILTTVGVLVETHGPGSTEIKSQLDAASDVFAGHGSAACLTKAHGDTFQRKAVTVVTVCIHNLEVTTLHRLTEFSKSSHSSAGNALTIATGSRAGLVATTTVSFVCFGVYTLSTTEGLSRGTDTFPSRTGCAVATDVEAGATMTVVRLRISTGSAAIDVTQLATNTGEATVSRTADLATGTTVVSVGAGVDTLAITHGLTARTDTAP